jgi:hypothetical protein
VLNNGSTTPSGSRGQHRFKRGLAALAVPCSTYKYNKWTSPRPPTTPFRQACRILLRHTPQPQPPARRGYGARHSATNITGTSCSREQPPTCVPCNQLTSTQAAGLLVMPRTTRRSKSRPGASQRAARYASAIQQQQQQTTLWRTLSTSTRPYC